MTQTKDNLLINQIKKRWEGLVRANPSLQQIAEFHQAVCLCVYRQPPQLVELPPQLRKGEVTSPLLKKKLEQGLALLQGEEEQLDFAPATKLFRELLHLASAYKGTLKGESQGLSKGLSALPGQSFLKKALTGARSVLGQSKIQEKERKVQQLLMRTLKGEMDLVAREAEYLNLSLPLLLTLIQYSLTPTLQTYASQLKSFLELDLWSRGYCPVCGAWPSLSELRGADQIRYLRCSLCGSDWVYPLLRCPYCENADHNRLEYFFIEGDKKRDRVYVCEECKGYIKMFSTLDPTPAELLNLEDLATLHLDIIASGKGYSRPYLCQSLPTRNHRGTEYPEI